VKGKNDSIWVVVGLKVINFHSRLRLRLIHHIIKNPCEFCLTHNFKLTDDFVPPMTADGVDEDAVNRFKRELMNN
jgi:hypothetical protein